MDYLSINHGRGRIHTLCAPLGECLTAEAVRDFAPAVFQDAMHPDRSAKHYKQTSVGGLFDQSEALGLVCTEVRVAGVRQLHREGFQKHILTFGRKADLTVDGDRRRLYALNSHDGTTGHQLWLGILRMVCENGLMSGTADDYCSTRHTGRATDKIAEALASMMDRWPVMDETIARWKTITLSSDEYYEYAHQAAKLRWPETAEEGTNVRVPAVQVLARRRDDDRASDLWTTFNVVQENLVRGGVQVVTTTDRHIRRVRARGVNAIDANAKLNRQLWALTGEFAKKAA